MSTTRMRSAALAAAAVALLAACGSSAKGTTAPAGTSGSTSVTTTATTSPSTTSPASTTPPTTAAAFPVTVSTPKGPLTVDAKPQHIVSLSPTATEMLFAIGAGSQVKAVDDQSNYPPEAPRSALSGFQPNIEAIAKEEPDLVVASDDTAGLVDGLTKVKIPVLIQPAANTLDDTYAEISQLGQVTGNVDRAAAVVGDMQTRIANIVNGVPKRATPLTYFHELDDTLYTATSKTFIGQVYALLGLQNIADAADSKGSGYPQLSAEYVVKADPRLIFLADTKCCKQSIDTVKARPGWAGIAAVREGGVVQLDDDIASRWGPRIVDYLQQVAQAVEKVGS